MMGTWDVRRDLSTMEWLMRGMKRVWARRGRRWAGASVFVGGRYVRWEVAFHAWLQ